MTCHPSCEMSRYSNFKTIILSSERYMTGVISWHHHISVNRAFHRSSTVHYIFTCTLNCRNEARLFSPSPDTSVHIVCSCSSRSPFSGTTIALACSAATELYLYVTTHCGTWVIEISNMIIARESSRNALSEPILLRWRVSNVDSVPDFTGFWDINPNYLIIDVRGCCIGEDRELHLHKI